MKNITKNLFIVIASFLFAVMPLFASAAGVITNQGLEGLGATGLQLQSGNTLGATPSSNAPLGSLEDVITYIINIFNRLVPLLIAMAVFWFLFGVVEFIRSAGDSKARDNGRTTMVYGLIGIAVMFSVWGFVNLLVATFRVDNAKQPDIPKFRTSLSTPLAPQV